MIPKATSTLVKLASGGTIRLYLCSRCQKPEISRKDEARLRHEKVQLGRCRCTPKQKGSASQVSNGPVALPMYDGQARHTDPDTSHEAAAKAKTGKVDLLVLGVLDRSDVPLDYGDIAERINKREVCMSSRLKPLREMGCIELVEKRVSPRSKRARWTYRITEHGRAVLEANRA